MYKITHEYLNMTNYEFIGFEKNLENFYKDVLDETDSYNDFVNKLKVVANECKNQTNKKQIEHVAKFISKYIKNVRARNLTSKLLAVSYLIDDDIFASAFKGGKVNFNHYIKCLIASKYANDNSLKILLQNEMYATARSMAEMRYYRYNAPDQLLK